MINCQLLSPTRADDCFPPVLQASKTSCVQILFKCPLWHFICLHSEHALSLILLAVFNFNDNI